MSVTVHGTVETEYGSVTIVSEHDFPDSAAKAYLEAKTIVTEKAEEEE